MSSHSQLPYKVQCKSGYPFWETIAAFDVHCAAERYAQACADGTRKQGLDFEYRVKARGKLTEVKPKAGRAA